MGSPGIPAAWRVDVIILVNGVARTRKGMYAIKPIYAHTIWQYYKLRVPASSVHHLLSSLLTKSVIAKDRNPICLRTQVWILSMEEVFKSVEDVTSWLKEKGFSADIVEAFKGMRVWSSVRIWVYACSTYTAHGPGSLDTYTVVNYSSNLLVQNKRWTEKLSQWSSQLRQGRTVWKMCYLSWGSDWKCTMPWGACMKSSR